MSDRPVSIHELRQLYRLLATGELSLEQVVQAVGEREIEAPSAEHCLNCGEVGHFPFYCLRGEP